MRSPDPYPDARLPSQVTIWEVGPRDGLQNESGTLPTAVKVALVDRLVAAGLPVVETTSFVRPDRVPQLADAAEVVAAVAPSPGVRLPVLVPNARGLERALAAGAREVAIFGSATESFARRNLNRSVAASVAGFAPVVATATAHGLRVRAYLSMCFGDPWEGPVPLARVVAAGRDLLDLGCWQLSLGDTIGTATPGHVTALLAAFAEVGVAADRLAVHFHDTYGQALANTFAALRAGVTTVDAAVGGLGGCPYAQSATGNLATEDLVWMLHGLGIATGVDLEALVATTRWLAPHLGKPITSRVARAWG
jgi:hydroxymethylglutaryl-CoA lyase